MRYFLAVDIGASSGRHILGHIEDGSLVTEEIYRFENRITEYDGALTWDIERLVSEVKRGIAVCSELGKLPVFLNVDCSIDDNNLLLDVFNGETWQKINGGVDLGLEYKQPKGDPWASDVFDD